MSLQNLNTHTDVLNIVQGGAAHLAGAYGAHSVGVANVAGPGSFFRIGLQNLNYPTT